MTEGEATWRVMFHRRALKELQRLPKGAVQRLWHAIEDLAVEPLPPGAQPVKGSEETYRIRIGDYRIIYHLAEETVTVLILRVGHRKDVYRNF
jgi:mRNA interferase RelE/StbE